MLHAVVTCGSFANAAEFLHISQPAISSALSKLQEQLGLPLLQIEGRKARVTETGRALLERSGFLLREAVELEDFAEHLKDGSGPEIRLAVSQDFPKRALMRALRDFSLHWRSANVHLIEGSMPQIDSVLQERAADLAINGRVPPGFHGTLLVETDHVAVAHPEHSLFRLKRELTSSDMEREIQIISNARLAAYVGKRHHGPGGARDWYVSNIETAVYALSECLGYGWLPRHRIESLLERGSLKILPLRNGTTYRTSFYLVHGRPLLQSPPVAGLAEILQHMATSAGRN